MILVDSQIKEYLKRKKVEISIEYGLTFSDNQIGPASIDLHMGRIIKVHKKGHPLSMSSDSSICFDVRDIKPGEKFTIEPNQLILASTAETVILPPNICAIVAGRSSISRLGLMIKCTQDFIQPGSRTVIPLQLVNITGNTIEIDTSVCICQLILIETQVDASKPYAENPFSKHKDEKAAEVSRTYTESSNADSENTKSKAQQQLKTKIASMISLIYIIIGASFAGVFSSLSPFNEVVFYPMLMLLIISIALWIVGSVEYNK